MVAYVGTWYDGTTRLGILYGTHAVVWDMGLVVRYMGKTPCGMVCVDGMVRKKHSIWYGTFAVWYGMC